ncbi:hypothetical protein ARTSIC4J27_991 [Pseudarthrobacter siccitolerans]|uniref:Uncharacterized protein n=1 Tax=Pseudarthrobacter siccitolerans TaxID=861266 RepID=A0A024GZ81_9MICC|nr:hypothetical protein [Pseudarthrobacter siccitolerans]CCQ45058.1 hypothetical protein ARTSIC4J27_991 [Pseudarthrobacter siccitolerans]
MKDNVPLIYWTFRTAWTVLHFLLVAVATAVLIWWALSDNNAERIIESAIHDVLDLQQRVASAVRWPWGA